MLQRSDWSNISVFVKSDFKRIPCFSSENHSKNKQANNPRGEGDHVRMLTQARVSLFSYALALTSDSSLIFLYSFAILVTSSVFPAIQIYLVSYNSPCEPCLMRILTPRIWWVYITLAFSTFIFIPPFSHFEGLASRFPNFEREMTLHYLSSVLTVIKTDGGCSKNKENALPGGLS